MMKNYQWFFLALLVSAQNLLAQQVTIIQQNQIPVASITDQVALQTSANDPSIYVFQEVPDFIQGAVIDLWQPEPPQPYEIHLALASTGQTLVRVEANLTRVGRPASPPSPGRGAMLIAYGGYFHFHTSAASMPQKDSQKRVSLRLLT